MAKDLLPSKGMRDFLPEDKALREKMMGIIRTEYTKHGFMEIETSIIENLDRLVNSDGGENTKLIFKILKRGDKLRLDQSGQKENDLADLGLRFDLTLPLSRYYCNNMNELPKIFKAMQTGYVYRAERPQKGRFRGFVQCDMDIMGDPTNGAEIELIHAISSTLRKLDLKNFTIKINDRRLLLGAIASCGYDESDFGKVCIILDKADKIGKEGVAKELEKEGYSEAQVSALMSVMTEIEKNGLEGLKSKNICPEAIESLEQIIGTIEQLTAGDYNIAFDFTLVRGMGYYTGTIFEIAYTNLGYSIGGGGRYDKMIGSFIGQDIPAVGFSIGFERIFEILKEEGNSFYKPKQLALIYNDSDSIKEVVEKADQLRLDYDSVSLFKREKKFGKQLERLAKFGFSHFASYDEGLAEAKELGVTAD